MAEEHKKEPLYSGWYMYFPRAHRAGSRVSFKGNEKHNKGEPLHWAKDKSVDQPNSAARHLSAPYALDPESGEMNLAHAFWRVGAWLEMVLEGIEKGLCTREDLESGRIDVIVLGPALNELERQAKNCCGSTPCSREKNENPTSNTGDPNWAIRTKSKD